ncbi:MAG: ribbon-helix-helix domain-containing protein [Rhizobiaceae bacterium]|nr:ribbon-helix-helix domain-containing protein [Rhizobiaceae bacterium]
MLVKHSISIRGHKTSYSLEDEFYQELRKIAQRENVALARLITAIDSKRPQDTNLSSALRLYVLRHVKS